LELEDDYDPIDTLSLPKRSKQCMYCVYVTNKIDSVTPPPSPVPKRSPDRRGQGFSKEELKVY
jgi:hypothetical protein